MLISKKLQLLYLINPYKQVPKWDPKLHNLHYVYRFKYNFSDHTFYLNMCTRSYKKPLRKKSKLKMASFSNNRSVMTNTSTKDSKDAPAEIQGGTISKFVINPFPSSSSVRSRSGNRERKNSKESIKSNINSYPETINSSENSTIGEQKIDTGIFTPSCIQGPVLNCGLFNIRYNSVIYPNLTYPICLKYYPQLQINSYYRNFMCRLENTASHAPNDTDAERERKLLWEWRTWQRTEFGKSFARSSDKHTTSTFTVMTYNVLAQDLLTNHPYLYQFHKPEALPWDQRWKNVLLEIKQHDADILCLQEVQSTHLESYYSQLKTLGYGEIYKKRTGKHEEGCAIYYKTSTLNLINYTTVEYNQPNIFVLNRDNIAIIAKFAHKQNLENEFVVATTHLLYNPRREDVRLAQTQVLLAEIDRMAYKRKSKRMSFHLPIIITGDFNFMPNTPVYKLITKGLLRYDNLASRSLLATNSNSSHENVTGKNFLPHHLGITDQCQHQQLVDKRNTKKSVEELEHVYLYHSERSNNYSIETNSFEEALFSSGVLSHHLALKSAFEHRRGRDIDATTFQDKWITVDYIFYSGTKDNDGLIIEDKLNLLSRYSLPTSKQLEGVRIPNMVVGSDHFSLVVKFKLNS